MHGAEYHRQRIVVKDDDDAQRRQFVVVVLELVALRVSVISDVPFQRGLLTSRNVTATTAISC